MMMTTKADRLREELQTLITIDSCTVGAVNQARADAIRKELAKLARRRASNRAYREMMFDLNGHHGRA